MEKADLSHAEQCGRFSRSKRQCSVVLQQHHALGRRLAGLLAGALSMAAGEYVSMRAQAELLERELVAERGLPLSRYDVLLNLANRGVEVLRLDAVGFIWKRLGTSCQNQPEVHDLLQALRACARIVAPAVIFKAEAIVSPIDLAAYLGVGRHHGRISDLAYHNSLMVQYWSAVATRDARLATLVLGRLPAKPASTAWATPSAGVSGTRPMTPPV